MYFKLKIMILTLVMLLFAGMISAAETAEYSMPYSLDPAKWQFSNGGEFPGAVGSLTLDSSSGGLTISYDFTAGGRYVAVYPKLTYSSHVKGINFKIKTDSQCRVNYRVFDANSRIFQGKPYPLKSGENSFSCSVMGPWSSSWSGKKISNPTNPARIQLMVLPGKDKKGSIVIDKCEVVTDQPPQSNVIGQDVSFSGCGWNFSAIWEGSLSGPVLKVTAENINGNDLYVALDFPEMRRNTVWRTRLDSKKQQQVFSYSPPLKNGGNPNNIYRITGTFTNHKGSTLKQEFVLTGNNASKDDLGYPKSSRNIVTSGFGVCTHFCHATPVWKDYAFALKMIDSAGLKWIRDGNRVLKGKDGKYHVRKYDLDWMKKAQKHNINTIAYIAIEEKIPLKEFKRMVTAWARETKGIVNVFELGNEPNNWGGWRQKFGGPWNAKEKDNSTSPWVKEHIKYINMAADAIKEVRPDSKVIALSAPSCVNFRYMTLGLTKNLDGIADHPYGYSLPPEQVPWGGAEQEKRDGVRVGDDKHTFKGLIEAYIEHGKRTGQIRSLWLTEFGFSTYWFDGKNEKGIYLGYSEQAQAAYIVRRFIEGAALPGVRVSTLYDFIDDYSSVWNNAEANFGIVRTDFSPKPSYYAVQHMASLFDGYKYAKNIRIKVEKQPLHRAAGATVLVKDWDKASIMSESDVRTYAFASRKAKSPLMLAVWSSLPFRAETNNRACTIRLKNMAGFAKNPVAVDVITGISFDVPVRTNGKDLVFENLIIKNHPIVIKFYKE